jgi:hypothetical protein
MKLTRLLGVMLEIARNRANNLGHRLLIEKDLYASKSVKTEGLNTVCLTLGPYRNLTTLTAAILFLHPNCQVLNHAGSRVFTIRRINFLSEYDSRKFESFKKYAIYISKRGKRRAYGGSITLSHAFDSKTIQDLFREAGGEVVKRKITCILWKEPLRTSNYIRRNNVDLSGIFKSNHALRFLLPIRNPLDCAVSNLRTGHAYRFEGVNHSATVEEVVRAILNEILWFEELKSAFPDRFFTYYQHEFSRDTLLAIGDFLKLDRDDAWLKRALCAFEVRSNYSHSNELISFYRQYVEQRFYKYPETAVKLLDFFNGKIKQVSNCR